MFWLKLVVSLKPVGSRVGPLLQHFFDGQTLVQGLFMARHGNALACTHLTPVRCVQHWRIVRGIGPEVLEVPDFLGRSIRWSLAMVRA